MKRLVKRPSLQEWGYGFDKVREKVKDREFVKEVFDTYSIKGFGHTQENCARQSPLVKITE